MVSFFDPPIQTKEKEMFLSNFPEKTNEKTNQ
jgi:hypothetical protein